MKKYIYKEISFVLLLSLISLIWFRKENIVLGHDSGFRIDYAGYFKSLFYSWNYIYNFGVDFTLFKGFLTTQLFELILSELTSVQIMQQTIFVFWFFAMGISMYFFVYSFFPERKYWVFRLLSSSLYMLNFYLLQGWFIAERAKFSLYAALPLGVLILYKTLTKEMSLLKGSILFALVTFFFNGGGIPSLYGALLLVYGLTVCYVTLLNIRKRSFAQILHICKVLVLFLILSFLLNAYWILPLVNLSLQSYSQALGSTGGIEGIIAWEQMVNKSASLLNLFRMQGMPDWYDNPTHTYAHFFISNPVLIFFSFIPIIIIFFGRYVDLRQKITENNSLILLMFFLLLIGILFTAGSHQPFGFFYTFLIKNIPGFAIFRSAFYKFAPSYLFALSFLAGYYLYVLLSAYIKKPKKRIIVAVLALLLVPLYHFPYFTPNFFNWHGSFSTMVTIPEYVTQMGRYVNENTDTSSRILLLPQNKNGFNADQYDWKYWSLDTLPRLLFDRSVIVNDTSNAPVVLYMYSLIDQGKYGELHKLFDRAQITHVLLRNDVFGDYTSDDFEKMRELTNLSSLLTLQQKFGEWELYSVNLQNKNAFVTTPQSLILTDVTDVDVVYFLPLLQDVNSALVTDTNSTPLKTIRTYEQLQKCEICSWLEFQNVKGSIVLPKQRFYPGSVFYWVVERDEERLQNSTVTPQMIIDTSLILIGRRLDEIRWLSGHDVKLLISEIDAMNSEITNLSEEINQQLEILKDQERIEYANRVQAYLEKYTEDFSWVDSFEDTARAKIGETDEVLKKSISKIATHSLLAKRSEQYYFVTFDNDSSEKLNITDVEELLDVRINNVPVSIVENVEFKEGFSIVKTTFSEVTYTDETKPVAYLEKAGDESNYSLPDVSYSSVDPTKVLIHISNAEDTFILRVNEQYQKGWILRDANRNDIKENDIFSDVFSVFYKDNEYQHFELDSYANGYLVNKSGDFYLVFEYKPQRIFYLGLAVSVVSLFASIAFIVYFLIKKGREKV